MVWFLGLRVQIDGGETDVHGNARPTGRLPHTRVRRGRWELNLRSNRVLHHPPKLVLGGNSRLRVWPLKATRFCIIEGTASFITPSVMWFVRRNWRLQYVRCSTKLSYGTEVPAGFEPATTRLEAEVTVVYIILTNSGMQRNWRERRLKVGFEPTTSRLTAGRSTAELLVRGW